MIMSDNLIVSWQHRRVKHQPHRGKSSVHHSAICLQCGAAAAAPVGPACRACGGRIGFDYGRAAGALQGWRPGAGSRGLARFARLLPIDDPGALISLGEGGTPLLPSRLLPGVQLFWKDETRNPTGSHKDRALALSISCAVQAGARRSVVVSAGSTGLSNAAYCAAAGLQAITLTSTSASPARLHPLALYGARVIAIDAGIDAIIDAARGMAGPETWISSTSRSSNPFQAEAPRTIALEVVEQLGDAPDWMVVPTGGGGTLAGIWQGFLDALAAGMATRLPRLAAVVPAAYDALGAALRQGIAAEDAFLALPFTEDVPTILTKIAHGHPPDGMEALAALRESRGHVEPVTDDEAIEGVGRIARTDGLLLEPSSGVVVAALERMLRAVIIQPGDRVVALGCGHAFRESAVLMQAVAQRPEVATLSDLAAL
jgi:threonine synthase